MAFTKGICFNSVIGVYTQAEELTQSGGMRMVTILVIVSFNITGIIFGKI